MRQRQSMQQLRRCVESMLAVPSPEMESPSGLQLLAAYVEHAVLVACMATVSACWHPSEPWHAWHLQSRCSTLCGRCVWMVSMQLLMCRCSSSVQARHQRRQQRQQQLKPQQTRFGRSWCHCWWRPSTSGRSRSSQSAQPHKQPTTWQLSQCCACNQATRRVPLTSCQPFLLSCRHR